MLILHAKAIVTASGLDAVSLLAKQQPLGRRMES
jgi:hypothetical protein